MVRNIITLLFVVLTNKIVFAQTPQKMSFQSVIRDELDNIVANNPIGMQISILKGNQKVYIENQMGTTNSNGLISFIIGNGTVVLGNFSNIDWGDGSYFIEIDTDPTGGTAYSIKSSSQLLSVPYALYAKTAEQIDKSTSTIQIDSLKSIINQGKEPQDATFWLKGDAKVDGKVIVNGHQSIYIPDQSLFDDSLVIGTGGLNLTNNPPNSLWPQSSSVNNGKQNTFVGIETGRDNTSGNQNTFVGSLAGRENTIGDQNTFIGMNAGLQNTTGYHSTYVGAWSGQSNTTGSLNSFFGTDAGNLNISGNRNSFYGEVSGFNNIYGNDNSFFGTTSGSNSTGDGNSFFGNSSGFKNTIGNYNTYIGNESGNHALQKVDVVNSIAIGYGAYTTKNNQVVIGNSDVTETLLSGNLRISTFYDDSKISFYSTGNNINERAKIVAISDGITYNTGELAFYTENTAGILFEQMRINKNGNIGIGFSTGKEITENKLAVNGRVNATSYVLSGNPILLDWTTSGFAGTRGQILISNGPTSSPIWTNFEDAGIAPDSGSSKYIQNQSNNIQDGNIWINGTIKTRNLTVEDGYGINAGNFQIGGISSRRFYVYNTTKGVDNLVIYPLSGNSIFRYNLGVGYTSEAIEVTNNKLAVNGNIYANGTITATAGKSTDWNAAYSWGNHKDLYKPINYTPDWFEISSNPFLFTSIDDNQLLKYNSITSKWENWTPNYLSSYTETDPKFELWDKSSGINITTSQINDFQISVSNNETVLINTAKNSYPIEDADKLFSIEAGAQKNVNADWNATSGDSQILNKPEISKGASIGDMQYWNGTSWVMIPIGQPGQFLHISTSNIPAWTMVYPIVKTVTPSTITANSVLSGGNVVSDGGGTIQSRGVCWSTSQNPTVSDNKTLDGIGTGMFNSSITELKSGTTYYIRAYASNNDFTAYGEEMHFTTLQ